MTRIDVWVCARPGARQLEAVLEALRAAGAKPRVAVAPAGRGPATARNDALARCDGEVLALVDDDVEVSEGWLEALQETWSSPDALGLACVGGPVGVRFVGHRPAWLGDALVSTLGVDPDPPGGPDALVEVDATKRTFNAGNLTFRAAALRGVGGFWPVQGYPGLRDRYGEEHRAQHELAELGWRVGRLPGAHAVRRIDGAEVRPRDLIVQRALYGVRSGTVGPPRRPVAAMRVAATAAAGVPVALARRDAAKVVERTARVVQHTGVVVAPLTAPRSLQPTARRTPFLHSVPPAARNPLRAAAPRLLRRVRRPRGGAPLILLYHRVATGRDDPMALMVSPEHFEQQLDVLAERRTPVPLEQIVGGAAPPGAVALTFDDGYVDTYAAARPALESAGIPATVFVSTGHVDSGRAFWWDAAARLLRTAPTDAGPLELELGGELRAWPAADAAQRRLAFKFLAAWVHFHTPEAIAAALRTMAAWARNGDPVGSLPDHRPITVDELRGLAASPVITIEAHGRDHACLAALSPDRQAEDLAAARDDLERWLSRAPAGIAYPYGVPGIDVDETTRAAARAAGYNYGVVNLPGMIARRTDRMALPRVPVPDVGADAFDAFLRTAP